MTTYLQGADNTKPAPRSRGLGGLYQRDGRDRVANGEIHAVDADASPSEEGYPALCGRFVRFRLRHDFGSFSEMKCRECLRRLPASRERSP